MYRHSYFCDYLSNTLIQHSLSVVCTPLKDLTQGSIAAVCTTHETTDKFPFLVQGNVALIKISHGFQRIPLHEVVLHHSPDQATELARIMHIQEIFNASNTQHMIRKMQTRAGQKFISVLTPEGGVLINEEQNWNNANLSQDQIFQHSAIALPPFKGAHDALAHLTRSGEIDGVAHLAAPLLQNDKTLLPQTLPPQ